MRPSDAEVYCLQTTVQELRAEIERLHMSNPADKILDHKWLDPVCIESGCQSLKLQEVAAFLDGHAGYLEREADAAQGSFKERDLRQEAADCRAMARKLRGEI